jgi:hypothetical protein
VGSYDSVMARGADEYLDVIAALREVGLPGTFVQTGGMCAALEVRLEAGYGLLITDADDTLSWSRETHVGWGVGLYSDLDAGDLAVDYLETAACDVRALLDLVSDILKRGPKCAV